MRTPKSASRLAVCLLAQWVVACGSAETTSEPPAETTCPEVSLDSTLPVDSAPDGPAACAAGDCNYQTQSGCDATEACRPQFNATEPEVHPGCELAGSAKAGEACTLQGDCERGLYCALEVCRRLCCGGDWSACGEGESCIRALDVRAGGQVLSAEAALCFPVGTCDPLDPESCSEPNRECRIVDPTGAVACVPASSSRKVPGEPCAPPDVCAQGASCIKGFCTKLCAAEACGEPACSAAEGTCVHFARDPAGVGECTLGR